MPQGCLVMALPALLAPQGREIGCRRARGLLREPLLAGRALPASEAAAEAKAGGGTSSGQGGRDFFRGEASQLECRDIAR